MNGAGPSGVVFDPTVLTSAQCAGDACVVCRKSWPRPRRQIGTLPGTGAPVHACDDCAPGLLRAIAEARTEPDGAEITPGGDAEPRGRHPIRPRRRTRAGHR